jgi:hypothetical protein
VLVQVNQGYVYGSTPRWNHEDTYKKVAADPRGVSARRAARGLPNPDSIDTNGTSFNSGVFDASTPGSGSFSAGSPGGNTFGGSVVRR